MLTDRSPMPFGKYRGQPMQKVPASYLHWLWCNGKKDEPENDIHKYISENFVALQKEDPDLIWD